MSHSLLTGGSRVASQLVQEVVIEVLMDLRVMQTRDRLSHGSSEYKVKVKERHAIVRCIVIA